MKLSYFKFIKGKVYAEAREMWKPLKTHHIYQTSAYVKSEICINVIIKLTKVVTGIPKSWLVNISSGQYNKFSSPIERISQGKPIVRTISPPTRGPVI
jgi:hypothetical protein